jgi:hypothetical protein
MTNIRCKGGKEIDLLALNPKTGQKYHVEARVGTSPSFKIRLHDTYTRSGRPCKIGIDYFAKEKFNHRIVRGKVKEIFGEANYDKWLVVWNVQDYDVMKQAKEQLDIQIVSIGLLLDRMIRERQTRGSRDDILRVVELMALSQERKDTKHMEGFFFEEAKDWLKSLSRYLDKETILKFVTEIEEAQNKHAKNARP